MFRYYTHVLTSISIFHAMLQIDYFMILLTLELIDVHHNPWSYHRLTLDCFKIYENVNKYLKLLDHE